MFIFRTRPASSQLFSRVYSTLVKSMEKHQVVPDVIPKAPLEVAEVRVTGFRDDP